MKSIRKLVLLLVCSLVIGMSVTGHFAVANQGSAVKDVFVLAPEWTRFEPMADSWRIAFALFTEAAQQSSAYTISAVLLDGRDITANIEGIPDTLPTAQISDLTQTELSMLQRYSAMSNDGASTNDADSQVIDRTKERIKQQLDSEHWVNMSIRPDVLGLATKEGQEYRVEVLIDDGDQLQKFVTTVAVVSLPDASTVGWTPAELHAHSVYSDGDQSAFQLRLLYADKGYQVLYITDHADMIIARGGDVWGKYVTYINGANGTGTSPRVYPGVEITSQEWDPYIQQYVYSDVTAYGVNSMTGLANKAYPPQTVLDNVALNNPGVSSSSIAHPFSLGQARWYDWNATNYNGFELMAAAQLNFQDTSNPATYWRREIADNLGARYTEGWFPSARAGADFHSGAMEDYVTYLRTTQWENKAAIDSALLRGQTVASRYGGFAEMIMNGAEIGDTLDLNYGNSVTLNINILPVRTGTYTVKVYRDNKAQEVYSWTGSITDLNDDTNLSTSFNYYFTGNHYYFLYISGPDYIYGSPIFVY